jgi:hypothetical protein
MFDSKHSAVLGSHQPRHLLYRLTFHMPVSSVMSLTDPAKLVRVLMPEWLLTLSRGLWPRLASEDCLCIVAFVGARSKKTRLSVLEDYL